MKKLRIAINGFGRIGRAFFRASYGRTDMEVVAINDLGDVDNLAYLLTYDTVYRRSPFTVEVHKDDGQHFLIVGGRRIRVVAERDPGKLPWKTFEVDIVVESTGFFASYGKSQPHLASGAKRVVITAPVEGAPVAGISGATVLMGINQGALKTCDISSNASCTTNAASPVMAILDEAIGIEKALLNTVHAYTATQSLVDGPASKDMRRGRAAAQNIVPASTGAAIAVTEALPSLLGKFDGIAIRVPAITGSLVDLTFVAKRDTTVEEVNAALTAAACEERWKHVFAVTTDPIVSSDIIGDTHASIADLSFTRVVGGNLVKALAWYDNEMGYTYALVEHVAESGRYIG